MTEEGSEAQHGRIELEYALSDPPEKVWRAVSIPEFRERWLPNRALTQPDPVILSPGKEVRYGIREVDPPFLDSVVTFTVIPDGMGGTRLRIVHHVAGLSSLLATGAAANHNSPTLMLAA